MAKVFDFSLKVNKLKFQSLYKIQIQILEKSMNLLILLVLG